MNRPRTGRTGRSTDDPGRRGFRLPGSGRLASGPGGIQEEHVQHGGFFFSRAARSGRWFFFLSLFATNMTAFCDSWQFGPGLSPGHRHLRADWLRHPGFVIYRWTDFFFSLARGLWALGQTVRAPDAGCSFFSRNRWECDGIGTAIFALSAAMLIPYMIISISGRRDSVAGYFHGQGARRGPLIPYWLGCGIVAVVGDDQRFFFGGNARATVWVNVFPDGFCFFCALARWRWVVISHHLPKSPFRITFPAWPRTRRGELSGDARKNAADGFSLELLVDFHCPPSCFRTWPSCVSRRRKVTAFKRTVVLYPPRDPWPSGLPCVFPGRGLGTQVVPD